MIAVSLKKCATVLLVVFMVSLLGYIHYQYSSGDFKSTERRRGTAAYIDWKSIPKNKLPPAEQLHDKWVVLTTINEPTNDVKKLADIEGWRVVVVGDTKTPKDWR